MTDPSSVSPRHVPPTILEAWTGVVCRHARAVILAALIVTAGAAYYTVRNLGIDTSTADMISSETPFRRNAEAFDRAFPQFTSSIVAVIDGGSPEAAERAAKALQMELAKRPALFKRIERPGGDPFFRRNGLLFFDIDELSRLADDLARAQPFLSSLSRNPSIVGLFDVLGLALSDTGGEFEEATLRRVLMQMADVTDAALAGEPGHLSWRGLLVSGDLGNRRFVVMQPSLDFGGFSPAGAAIDEIRRAQRRLNIDEANGLRLRLTGSAVLDHEELKSAELGGKTAGVISLALVTLLLGAGLRSFRLIAATLATLLVGLIWTAGFAAMAIGSLNLISVAFAVLFIGLAVDFSIHFSLRYNEALRDADGAPQALGVASRSIGGSLAISGLCAAVGFYAFAPTDYKGFAELGMISGTGMFIALFANFTVLPALLVLFKGYRPRKTVGLRPFLDNAIRRHHRVIICVGFLAALAALPLLAGVRFDFNPLNLKDPASESVATFLDLARDPKTSAYTIDVLAKDRAAAAVLGARLARLDAVDDAVTLASFVPKDQDRKLSIIEEMAWFIAPALVPAEPGQAVGSRARWAAFETFAAKLAAYSMNSGAGAPLRPAVARLKGAFDKFAAALPRDDARLADLDARLTGYAPDMIGDLRTALGATRITIDGLPEALRRDWQTPSGTARVRLTPARPIRSNEELRDFAHAILAAAPSATGTPVTITEAGTAVVTAFVQATVIAVVAITVLLLLILRNGRLAFLALLPVGLAFVYTAAASAALDLPFNFANVIVLPLLFALGVASSIHLVMRRRGIADASRLMSTSTPRAILYSTLTTLASFGSLAASGHRGMVSMGLLLMIAIVAILVSALVILPAFMTWRDARNAENRPGQD